MSWQAPIWTNNPPTQDFCKNTAHCFQRNSPNPHCNEYQYSPIYEDKHQIRLLEFIRNSESRKPEVAASAFEAFILQMNRAGRLQQNEVQSAIASLLDRELWHRAWVYQEVALANNGYLLCRLILDVFGAALSAIMLYRQLLIATRRRMEEILPLLKTELLTLRGVEVRRNRKLELRPRLAAQLFYKHQRSTQHFRISATKAVDIIYSLLGISGDTRPRQDINGNSLDPAVKIKVDYNKSEKTLFTETTKAFIKSCEWYRLEYCDFPKDITTLPSWVPDYRRIASKGLTCNPISLWKAFNASGNRTHPQFREAANPNSLLREGCRVDVVSSVMERPAWEYSKKELDFKVQSRSEWLRQVQAFAIQSPDHVEDVWTALVAGLQQEKLTGRTFRLDENWKRAVRWLLSDVAKFTWAGYTWWGLPKEEWTRENFLLCRTANMLISWAEWIGYGRTLFRTENGRVGLGPENVRAGDVVFIIFGTQVPIILREDARQHKSFLGEAYVHGIMDGEYVRTEPEPEPETLELV